jgi:hypothetical protein
MGQFQQMVVGESQAGGKEETRKGLNRVLHPGLVLSLREIFASVCAT